MRTYALRILLAVAGIAVLPGCLKEPAGAADVLLAPSGLTAVPLPEGARIQLTWMDNSVLESGFRVDVADTPIIVDSDVDEWATVPANVATYTYATQPNTTKYFRVLAVTTLGQSEPSNVVSATTPNVPLAPARLDALVGPTGSDISVWVAWDDTFNETGYAIERSIDGTNWASLAAVGQNATSYVDGSTTYNMTYWYRVRGTNANGSGVWALSPPAKTRNTSWNVISSSAIGDVSWNVSMVARFGNVFLSAYDATYGDLVFGSGYVGATGLFLNTLNPGFPETLGFSGTSVAVSNLMYPDYVAVDAFNDKLYHLSNSSGSWVAVQIDSAIDTDRAVVRSGPDNILHVVYQHDAGGYPAIRHAWSSGGGWSYEWLDLSLPASDYLASAVDSSNGLHVVYRRPLESGLYELRYVHKPLGGFPISVIVPTTGNPEMCSITPGASDEVHVAYNSLTTGGLHLATRSGGSWVNETIHTSPRGSWGRYNSIAYEAATGDLHVAYCDNLYGGLRYATKAPTGAWNLQLIDRMGGLGRFAVVDLDAQGNVFIACADGSSRQIKLAMNAIRPPSNLTAGPVSTSQILLTWQGVPNATGYRVERSDDGGTSWSSIATPDIYGSYYLDSGLNSTVEYQYRVIAANQFGASAPSNVATAVPVYIATPSFASSADFGAYTSIAVTSSGGIHVSHYDVLNSNTLYTTGTAGGPFTTITADTGPAANSIIGYQGTGIVREDSGVVRIVSGHLANGSTGVGDLRYTSITGGVPSTIILESAGQVGNEPHIVKAPDNTLHIIQREAVAGGHRLRQGTRTVGSDIWSFSYATPSELIVSSLSNHFAVGANGSAHLTYIFYPLLGTPSQLKYGVKSGSLWTFSTLADAGTSIAFPALVVDGAGVPHLTFVGTPPGGTYSLMHGWNASGVWVYEPIPGPTSISAYGQPATVIDPMNGRMHVAYGTYGELRYARKDVGGAWVIRRLDKGNIGHVSIAVDGSGMIHIAYRDESLAKLKILSGLP
jgi:hypothetical protein